MSLFKTITRRLVLDYSPFQPLQEHSEKVCETLEKLAKVLNDYTEEVEVKSEEVSELEHEADIIKQGIRSSLPRSDLFLPVARMDILSFLWQQDQIADSCQDAGNMLSLLPINLSAGLREGLQKLSKALQDSAQTYRRMVNESTITFTRSLNSKQIDELWGVINEMNELEHKIDIIEGELVKEIYKDDSLDGFRKYHLIQVVLKTGDAIDHMENAGEYLRIMSAK